MIHASLFWELFGVGCMWAGFFLMTGVYISNGVIQ